MSLDPSALLPVKTSQASVGERFGRLVVTAVGRSPDRHYYAVCDCDCGTRDHVVQIGKLRLGLIQGCGCGIGAHLITHGQTNHPMFGRWQGIMARCYYPSHPSFENYGGRGIKVCERWHDPANFIADMEAGFDPALEIDRINNDGDYEPGNCRWVERPVNLDNRRITHIIEWEGETLPLRLWAKRLGISHKLLAKRLYERGWSVKRAFTTQPLSRSEAGRIANAASQKVKYRR